MDNWKDASDNSKRSYDVGVEALRERLEKSKVEIGPHTLFNEDCRFVLPTLGRIDCMITDPPYGSTACSWDCEIDPSPLWDALDRLINPKAAMVFFGAMPFTARLIMSKPEWFKYQWVWDKVSKTDFMNAKNRPLREHEDIAVFSKGTTANCSPNRMTYNPQGLSDADRSKSDNRSAAGYMGSARPSHADFYKYQNSNYPGSILRFSNANRNEVEHPTQKPLALLKFLVSTYSDPFNVILDPFVGSGTTGVACARLGRRFIGIEIEPRYFEIACRRIEEATKQADLFIPEPKKEKPIQEVLL